MLETCDPEAESFVAGLFVVLFLFGGITAAVAGIWALVNRLPRLGKRTPGPCTTTKPEALGV